MLGEALESTEMSKAPGRLNGKTRDRGEARR